ncbi:MAG: alpha/beta hydrolase-fold protein [Bacteroidota bacterium]
MKKLFVFLLSLLVSYHSKAQEEGITALGPWDHTLESEILQESRSIQVYLPPNYVADTDQEYPVVYLLDGQQFFHYGVSLSHTFQQFGLTPEFIMVGINTRYPQRYRHFTSGKEDFMGFLQQELIPHIEETYRTSGERLLFGWQYAGSLAFHMLLETPATFNGYFLASPFPIEGQVDALGQAYSQKTTLCFSVSPGEYNVNRGTDKLDSVLTHQAISGLDWQFLELASEEHHSTGYPTLYHGLRMHFKYYKEFQEDNLEKFLEAGGLDYAYAYARQRGAQYGLSAELSTWSKYTIIRSAIRASDYAHFQAFVNEFVTDEFLVDLGNNAQNIAAFYAEQGEHSEALNIYEVLLEENPNSERLLNRIGDTYTAMGNTAEAEKYYQRATEASGDE